jgi:hypothetical protein
VTTLHDLNIEGGDLIQIPSALETAELSRSGPGSGSAWAEPLSVFIGL